MGTNSSRNNILKLERNRYESMLKCQIPLSQAYPLWLVSIPPFPFPCNSLVPPQSFTYYLNVDTSGVYYAEGEVTGHAILNKGERKC